LFVSSIYPRAFTNQQTAVSSQVRTIVDAIAASPRIGRKELADKLIVDLAGEEAARAKLALASDLIWLISAGRVIEFNDGSLDLPRAKAKPKEEIPVVATASPARTVSPAGKDEPVEAGAPPTEGDQADDVVAAAVSAAEPNKQA